MKLDYAIDELTHRIEVNDTNAKINEKEGQKVQAALERKISKECKGAIARLKESPFDKKK